MAISVWEAVFMLLVLKIPLVYLGIVLWWAIRAEPRASGPGDAPVGALVPLTPCGWDEWHRRRVRLPRRPVGPRGGLARRGTARRATA